MNCLIGKIKEEEFTLLQRFTYEAIFVAEGEPAPSMEIIHIPTLQIYYKDFGKRDDICYLAEIDGEIVGAAWTRIMNDYGHVDDKTPSWAISILKDYRGKGIGTRLMNAVIAELQSKKYKQTSLSVQKAGQSKECRTISVSKKVYLLRKDNITV